MATVIHRTTKEIRRSVNSPDFDTGTWVVYGKAELSKLGVLDALLAIPIPSRHVKFDGFDNPLEMTQAEKDAVDAAIPVVINKVLPEPEIFVWEPDPVTATVSIAIGSLMGFEMPNGGVGSRAVLSEIRVLANYAIELSNAQITLDIDGFTSAAGSGPGDVRLRMALKYVAATELVNKPDDQVVELTIPVTNTEFLVKRFSLPLDMSLLAAGDRILVKLERLPAHVEDTFEGAIAISRYGIVRFVA